MLVVVLRLAQAIGKALYINVLIIIIKQIIIMILIIKNILVSIN